MDNFQKEVYDDIVDVHECILSFFISVQEYFDKVSELHNEISPNVVRQHINKIFKEHFL